MTAVLFLDIDGPLIPFGLAPEQYAVHRADSPGNPLLVRVDPAHGPRLAALPCELVWATTWENDANESVAPLLGLPPLPVVTWPDDANDDAGVHWKTRALVEWADGRPFAWIDDEITDADRAWVAAHHEGRALLHRVDPRYGLTDADYAVLAEWLRGQELFRAVLDWAADEYDALTEAGVSLNITGPSWQYPKNSVHLYLESGPLGGMLSVWDSGEADAMVINHDTDTDPTVQHRENSTPESLGTELAALRAWVTATPL
ncbi:HAD domain-containing protein [Actinokineospora globicatena]|uniref:HAD domain-containing protein n=1 Tax=Actinokineospora globicatena TaxID=103729 RepID=UPI0020A29D69|nr:HAD domain-containing protein [Actinokineospora globicatena]MCP2304143.1 hypothetical protein [Actinokineospora globicatena]GLW78502.1 hypothetical protein Aglo01_29840 [Actinokineospora globicatena]GLW84834.1 hypothetical protein Aglo02_24740 [Actinokineospora globicatena]